VQVFVCGRWEGNPWTVSVFGGLSQVAKKEPNNLITNVVHDPFIYHLKASSQQQRQNAHTAALARARDYESVALVCGLGVCEKERRQRAKKSTV
jgi:tryptophan synthase alpha subunit